MSPDPTEADATSDPPPTGSEGTDTDLPPAACGDGQVAPGELCLGEVVTVEGGGEASRMHGADLDGDGDLDLVISSSTTATPFIGDGHGGFTAQPPITTLDGGAGSSDLVLAKVDPGDAVDLVVSNGYITIAALLGDGDGGFATPVNSTYPGVNGYGLVPGDYTNDGITDLLVARTVGSDVHFGVGTGTGSFSFTTQLAVTEAGPMLAGDFDGDGNLDAVIGQSTAQTLAWLRGSGTDTMTPQSVPMGVGLGLGRPAGADLDGDGTDDAVFPIGGTDRVAVVLGAVGVGPTPPLLLETTGAPVAAGIADLDADGMLDVASCGSNLFAALSVWRGDGSGGFAPVEELAVTPCLHLVLGDLDGDGAIDVAYHDGGPSGLHVVLATP